MVVHRDTVVGRHSNYVRVVYMCPHKPTEHSLRAVQWDVQYGVEMYTRGLAYFICNAFPTRGLGRLSFAGERVKTNKLVIVVILCSG